MREIKFRAWGHKGPEDEYKMHMNISKFDEFMLPWVDEDPICDHSLMQFTGLKDKNDADIYEGDIVNMPMDGEMFIIEVAFTIDRYFNGWEVIPQHIEDGLEVIGNVHQNPELLEDK